MRLTLNQSVSFVVVVIKCLPCDWDIYSYNAIHSEMLHVGLYPACNTQTHQSCTPTPLGFLIQNTFAYIFADSIWEWNEVKVLLLSHKSSSGQPCWKFFNLKKCSLNSILSHFFITTAIHLKTVLKCRWFKKACRF